MTTSLTHSSDRRHKFAIFFPISYTLSDDRATFISHPPLLLWFQASGSHDDSKVWATSNRALFSLHRTSLAILPVLEHPPDLRCRTNANEVTALHSTPRPKLIHSPYSTLRRQRGGTCGCSVWIPLRREGRSLELLGPFMWVHKGCTVLRFIGRSVRSGDDGKCSPLVRRKCGD